MKKHSPKNHISTTKTFAFIDASNLFYGGEKSLGWKIDYQKLLTYLKNKYNVSKAFYFGGVETHGFTYDYLKYVSVPLNQLVIILNMLAFLSINLKTISIT